MTSAVLIRQENGGALRRGNPGNAGGPGRPASALRQELRGSFAERKHVLEDIVDGEAIQRMKVPLALLLPHVECPNCGEIGVVAKERSAELVQIEARVSASPADRIKALDLMAKYGLGAARLTEDDIKARLTAQIQVITTELPAMIRAMKSGDAAEGVAEALLKKLEAIW